MPKAATNATNVPGSKARYYALRPWKAADVAWRFHLAPRVFPKRLVKTFYRRFAKPALRYSTCPAKEPMPLCLVAFTDAGYLDLLTENLWSLCHAWRRLPELRIVGDIGSNEAEFRAAFKWWPGPWEFVAYEAVEQSFASQGREWLTALGRRHFMWRKAAVVLYSALRGPSLYVDSDFLWCAEPRFLQDLDFSRRTILGSTDIYPCYSRQLLGEQYQDVIHPPFTCAGLVYINGWPWPEEILRQWIAKVGIEPDYFSEQTMMACLVRRYGRNIPLDDITISDADEFSLIPGHFRPAWSGRHYTNTVRHHFFRDALLLRQGVFRPPTQGREQTGRHLP